MNTDEIFEPRISNLNAYVASEANEEAEEPRYR